MSLDISAFKGQFISGARPTHYKVIITELGPGVEFLAKGTSLPASTLGQIEVPTPGGRQLKVAGNRTFADWTVTVLMDVNFDIRRELERWSDEINGHQSNFGYVNVSDYMRDATVQQLDQQGGVLYTYNFSDIWPAEVGEVDMAFDSTDTISEFTVTFAVGTYWKSDGAQN